MSYEGEELLVRQDIYHQQEKTRKMFKPKETKVFQKHFVGIEDSTKLQRSYQVSHSFQQFFSAKHNKQAIQT